MTFDASSFLNQTVEGAMSTRLSPVPEGEYMARIGTEENSVEVESVQGKKDPTKTFIRLTLQWEILDDNLKQTLGRETIRVRDQFLLDVDPVTGLLSTDKEKNVALGRRREALGLNDGTFNLGQLRGAGPVMIQVKHTPNEKDPESPYAEVYRVAKLG